jgi:hypothetical protein
MGTKRSRGMSPTSGLIQWFLSKITEVIEVLIVAFG